MIRLAAIMLLSSLAVVPSLGIYGIKKMNLTPEEQFVQINIATRRLNARYELKRQSGARHMQGGRNSLQHFLDTIIEFLDALGKAIKINLNRGDVHDFRVGRTIIQCPRIVSDRAVPQNKCRRIYRERCWRKAHCNLGQGVYGECFTNAVKFALSFGYDSINSMTFPDQPQTAVVLYPNNICSVVWKIKQKVMNFFFDQVQQKKKEVLSAFAATLSAALEQVSKFIENASDDQGDCTEVPDQTFQLGNGSKIECKGGCRVCGFNNMNTLPEIKVHEVEKNKKIDAAVPINVPPLKMGMNLTTPDGKKDAVVINIGNINANANVSFNLGDTIKITEANIDAQKYSGIELLGVAADKLPEEKKRKLMSTIAEAVNKGLKEKWSSLGQKVAESIQGQSLNKITASEPKAKDKDEDDIFKN